MKPAHSPYSAPLHLCVRVAAAAFEKELAAHSRPIGRVEGDDKDKAETNTKTGKNKKGRVN